MNAELADVVDRIGALDPYLACGIGRDDPARPWLAPSALAAADGRLERLATAYGERWSVPADRCSQASYVILDYSWYAFAPLVATFLSEGVVPRLDGAQVALEPQTRIGRLALVPLRPRRGASVDDLRDEIVQHVTPIVEAVVERRWLGQKPAWWGVGDRVVGAFEYLGDLIGQPDRARDLASGLVHAPGSPLDSPRHRFASFEHLGVTRTVGLRAACCRFHRVPGEEKCLTCPILAPEEREGRIRAEIETSLAVAR